MHALAFDHHILFLKQLEEVRERFSRGVQASFRTVYISALLGFLTAWCVIRLNPAMIFPASRSSMRQRTCWTSWGSKEVKFQPATAGGPCKEDASGSRERWVSAPAGRSLMAALQEWSSWRYKDSFLRLILKRGRHKLLQKVQVGRNPAFGWVLEVLLGQAGHIICDCGESRRSPRTRFPCSPAAPAMQNVVLPPSHVRPLRLSQSHFLTGESLRPQAQSFVPPPRPGRPSLGARLLCHLRMGWFGSSSVSQSSLSALGKGSRKFHLPPGVFSGLAFWRWVSSSAALVWVASSEESNSGLMGPLLKPSAGWPLAASCWGLGDPAPPGFRGWAGAVFSGPEVTWGWPGASSGSPSPPGMF